MQFTRFVTGRLAVAGLVTAVAVLSVGPALSGAQLGGLLRRGINEVTKGAEPKEAAKEVATEPAAPPPGSGDPNVVDVNDAVLTALEKSLQTEIRLREDMRKELAALKTQEEYNACSVGVITSPEAQAISMRIGELPENATAEQMQNLMARNAKDLEALLFKGCGVDPRQFDQTWRAKRLNDIQRQAAGDTTIPR